jgi:hypothetical protein
MSFSDMCLEVQMRDDKGIRFVNEYAVAGLKHELIHNEEQ